MARLRRLTKEIQQFMEDPPEHIWIDYSDDNLTNIQVLFIGPRYSPYSRMFLRFQIDFPEEYPIKPPKVQFTSSHSRKIHPNVFPGGWVCLSTLNTGDASGWVPSINLTALLATVYSMFTKEMIMTDNSHEHEKSEEFFPGIMYDTFFITEQLLKHETNEKFKKIMYDYLESHREWYVRKLTRLAEEWDGKELRNYYQNRVANFGALIPTFLG